MKNLLSAFLLLILFNVDANSQLSELTHNSDVIIKGAVSNVKTKWNSEKTLIRTFYTIEIESVFRGRRLTKNLIISTVGGMNDGHFHYSPHNQSLSQGDAGYLFLKDSPDGLIFSNSHYGFVESSPKKRFIKFLGQKIYKSDFENKIIQNIKLPMRSFDEYVDIVLSGYTPDLDTCDIIPTYREGNHSIEFKFDNVRYNAEATKLEFDLLAKVSTPGLKFGGGSLFVRYTEEFGENVVENSSVTVTEGVVLENPLYSLDFYDHSSNSMAIIIASDNPNNSLHTFGSEFEPLVQVSIEIVDFSQIGTISFDELDIFGQVQYWCQGEYHPFNEIIIDDPINTAQFGTPIGLTYTFDNLLVNSSQDAMSVELYAEATEASLYSDAFIFINYNDLGFGENVVNNGLSFVKEDLLDYQNEYEVFLSDVDNNTFRLIVFHASDDNFSTLSDVPRKLGTLTFPINDCEELKDLNFDINTEASQHIHYTGQMPIPNSAYDPVSADDPQTGSICGCETPEILSFSPSVIRAGTGEILTITGNNFGQFSDSESTVIFKNGDDNSNDDMEAGAFDFKWDNVIHWTDNEIQIKVPSTDKDLGAKNPASTGKIKVKSSCDVSENSSETLFIPFAIMNARVGAFTGTTAKMTIKGTEGDGICFRFTDDTPNWIRDEFEDALFNWCVTSGINFYIGSDVPSGTTLGEDDINVIKYSKTGFAGAMVIEDLYYSTPCTNGELGFPFSEIDFRIQGPENPVPGQEEDMEELITHELGHSHMLAHARGSVILDQPIMHPNGNLNGIITTDDSEGANLVFINSSNIVVGSCGAPIGQGSCGSSCTTTSVYDATLATFINVSPNPSQSGNIKIQIDHDNLENAQLNLYTNGGINLMNRKITSSNMSFELPKKTGIYYLEFIFDNKRFIEKVVRL